MASVKPFESDHVIFEQMNVQELRAYHIGFDQQIFRLEPLVDVIRRVIPEYALGFHQGASFTAAQMVDRVKDAACTLYTTDKYKSRGEFGELILHLLLRDFFGTIPLISTIYFRDAPNVPAHGFDGVHVVETPGNEKLFMGESKLYKDGPTGIRDLIGDMKKHLQNDYLRQQFNLVSRKIPSQGLRTAYWQNVLHQHNRLDEVFKKLVVPMVCTYNSELFVNHTDNTTHYFSDFEDEGLKLLKQFQAGKTTTAMEFVLLLLPVPCKDALNTALHNRVKAMQSM